jgi:predicted phage terminase large subunit-like protein
LFSRIDIQWFGECCFPHYTTDATPEFHRELYDLFQRNVQKGGTRTVIAAPREHAKSTVMTLIGPLWCICHPELTHKKFLLIVSDTQGQANARLAEIKEELEHNERLKEMYPAACGAGARWTEDEIVTAGGIKIVARGTGGKVRGLRHGPYRPDLIIGDDLENDENSVTPAQRDKITAWFYKALSKAGGKHTDIFVLGTVIHYDSLLRRLLANPMFNARLYRGIVQWSRAGALWEEWERLLTDGTLTETERETQADDYYQTHKDEMLEGAEVLWPAHKPYVDLMKMRVMDGPASFDSEIQNEPVNPDDCYFQEEWFHWFEPEQLGTLTHYVAAVDPSLGRAGKNHDPSAIVCLGRDAAGIMYVLDADIVRRKPDKIIDDAIDLYQRRKLDALGVESVQFQEFFADELTRRANERGIYPPVRQIQSTKDKLIRIQRLQPLIKNGTIRFQKRQRTMIDQLKYFPLADHDDGPDALEMAVQMIESIGPAMRVKTSESRIKRPDLDRIYG